MKRGMEGLEREKRKMVSVGRGCGARGGENTGINRRGSVEFIMRV